MELLFLLVITLAVVGGLSLPRVSNTPARALIMFGIGSVALGTAALWAPLLFRTTLFAPPLLGLAAVVLLIAGAILLPLGLAIGFGKR